MLNTCYKEMAFPRLPDELMPPQIDAQTIAEVERLQSASTKRRSNVLMSSGLVRNAFYKSNRLRDEELSRWVAFNMPILNGFKDAYWISTQETWGTRDHTPHTDSGRYGQFIYVIELGGRSVVTSWYRERGKPLFRQEEHLGKISDTTGLEKIESVVLKEHTWYFFNTKILHGVENLDSRRKSVSISFETMQLMTAVAGSFAAQPACESS